MKWSVGDRVTVGGAKTVWVITSFWGPGDGIASLEREGVPWVHSSAELRRLKAVKS